MRAMMGRVRDAVSLWGLRGLLRDVPELREAWEDPLFEHARETGRSQLRTDSDLAQVVGYLSVLVLAAIVAAIAPAGFITAGVAGCTVVLILALFAWSARPGTPRDLLMFLDVPDHPLWAELPMTPDRAARLIALKGVLNSKTRGPMTTPMLVVICIGCLSMNWPDYASAPAPLATKLAALGILAALIAYHAMVDVEAWGIERARSALAAWAAEIRKRPGVRHELSKNPDLGRLWSPDREKNSHRWPHIVVVLLMYSPFLAFAMASVFQTGKLGFMAAYSGIFICTFTVGRVWRRIGGDRSELARLSAAIRDLEGMMELWRIELSREEQEE